MVIGGTVSTAHDVLDNELYITKFIDDTGASHFNGLGRWWIQRNADELDDDYPEDAWVFGALIKYS